MNPALPDTAKQRLEDLLSFFGANVEVTATSSEDTIELSVNSEAGGRLIGHRGETLAAIQHVLNMMMRRETDERIYVHVDIGGYRQARLAKLEEQAQEAITRARAEGVEVPLPMMSAAERRHLHTVLGEIDGIVAESQGEGSRRRLVIKPATA
ncbi:MAG TPA: KH domain-containing protein [Candidatus Saccharimonadales bacterium]|nr:KH domain-containing protein [Candidatus Saccharimonadales bacterium]